LEIGETFAGVVRSHVITGPRGSTRTPLLTTTVAKKCDSSEERDAHESALAALSLIKPETLTRFATLECSEKREFFVP